MVPTSSSDQLQHNERNSSSSSTDNGDTPMKNTVVVPRPLAPPEVVGVPSSEEGESDPEQQPEEVEDDVSEDDEELAEAVDKLLQEVERLRVAKAFSGIDELEAIDHKREVYLGPTMESNWVLPGSLLVGAYPASMNDSHHAHLLCTILLQGVSTFVCLQQEYRALGVTEEMWRSGEALRPYFQDVIQLLRKLHELKAADPRAVPTICPPQDTDFVHFPIVDCNIADDTKVLHLACKLVQRLAKGEVLYLHCWGGHGRTGTVVSIMLHLMYGLSADEAMERCQHVHDIRRIPISVGSPQTEHQREQVRRVVDHLVRRPSIATSPLVTATADTPPLSGITACPDSKVSDSIISNDETSGNKVDKTTAMSSPETKGSHIMSGAGSSRCGGRRGWVRGRRQAFAEVPNGIGEHTPEWPPGDVEDGNQELSSEGGECGGRRLRTRTIANGSSSLNAPCAVGEGVEAAVYGAGGETASTPRRKSIAEPYSAEDPSRGTRISRPRRKSASGKPTAEAFSEVCRGDVNSADASDDVVGKEDDETLLFSACSPSQDTMGENSMMTASMSGVDVAASPGSCTGVERCGKRSSSGGGMHASPCRGNRRAR